MPRPHLGYRQIAAESPQWTYMASAGLRWALLAYLPLTLGIAWLELRQRLIIGTDGITVVERVGSRSLSWSEISHFDAEDTDVLLVCRSGQTMQIRALRALSMTAEEAMRRVDQLNEALLGATAIDGGTAAGPVWPVWPVWPVEGADAVPPDAVPPADHGLPYRRPKQPTRLQRGRSRLLGVAWLVAVILLLSLPSSSGSTSSSSSTSPLGVSQ